MRKVLYFLRVGTSSGTQYAPDKIGPEKRDPRRTDKGDTSVKRNGKTAPRNEREAQARSRALHALAKMRRDKLSLAEACRLEHIKPATFRRYIGSAVQQERPGGRYRAVRGDRFRRDLQIPGALGPTAVPIHGSKKATRVSNYLNAVGTYLRTGDQSKLRAFEGVKVGPRGRPIKLITDPATLSSLAEAGALQLDQLYAAFNTA